MRICVASADTAAVCVSPCICLDPAGLLTAECRSESRELAGFIDEVLVPQCGRPVCGEPVLLTLCCVYPTHMHRPRRSHHR